MVCRKLLSTSKRFTVKGRVTEGHVGSLADECRVEVGIAENDGVRIYPD